MGLIRDRMETDLKLKGCSIHTQDGYLRYAGKFVGHYMRPPDKLGEDEVRGFLRHLVDEQHVEPATLRMYVAAIKFLYGTTLRRPDVVEKIPWPTVPKKLPDILSGTEVERVFGAIHSIKYRAILMTAYGAGLRISEACSLRTDDIDSNRRLIHVRQGKRNKDRFVPLPQRLLLLYREYWRATQPSRPYLFPGRTAGKPITGDAVSKGLATAVTRLGLQKRVTAHVLRHAFATHLLELGTDVRVVQVLLGHASPRSTTIYTHVSAEHVARIVSPLDVLGTEKAQVLR